MRTQNVFVPRSGMWVEYELVDGYTINYRVISVGHSYLGDQPFIEITCNRLMTGADIVIYYDKATGITTQVDRRSASGKGDGQLKKLIVGFGNEVLHTYEVE